MSKKNETTTVDNTNAAGAEALSNNAPAAAPAVVTTPVADKKSIKANAIFKEMFAMDPRPARKDMIARVVAEAGLTQAGAATYLQNYKTKNGLVAKKAEAAPAA